MAFLKKKFNFPDDNIIAKILLSQDFEPKKNKTVQEIIDNIDSEAENLTNFPKINETYPKLNLNQLNVFLEALKKVFAVNNNEPVNIEEIHFYQKVPIKKKKYKWEDYLVINDLEIKVDFLNLSVPVIEAFFSNPEFDEASYDDKVQASDEFLKEFERQTGLPKDQLAVVPTKVEVEDDNLSGINPNLRKEQERRNAIKKKEQAAKIAQAKRDAEQARLSDEAYANAKKIVKNHSQNPAEQVTNQPMGKRTRKSAVNQANNDSGGIKIENDGHVYAPQFEIKKLPESYGEPSNPGYVEFMINEKKKEVNTSLRSFATQLNTATDKKLSKKAEEYRTALDKSIAQYQKDNINKTVTGNIQDKIKQTLLAQKEVERNNRLNDINATKKKSIAEAQRIFNEAKDNANQIETESINKLDDELSTKYAKLGNQKYDSEIDKLKAETEKQINKLIINEVRTSNNNLNGNALENQEINNKQLNEAYDKFTELLADWASNFEQQHSSAVRVTADADAAKYKLQDAENDKQALAKYKNQYEEEHQNSLSKQAQINELEAKINNLTHDLKNKENQIANHTDKKDDLSDLYKLLMLQNKPQQQPQQPQMQNKSHVVAWLVGILSIVVIASAGMIGGLIYQNQTLNSQKISRLSKSTNEMNRKVNISSEKLNKTQEKLKKNQNKNDQLKSQLQQQQDKNNQLQSALINK